MSPPFFCHLKVMSKKNKPVQFSLLALFLIVMPLGSWYFLNKGYNYYDKAIKELQDYGPMPTFQLVNQNDRTVNNKMLEGKMAVVAFLNPQADYITETMKDLVLVHK